MQDFKRLLVWQKAHSLFIELNRCLTPRRCRSYRWLRSQILRAAASAPANIAEGCGKQTTREFARFIDIATGSTHELENHLIEARDLRIITVEEFDKLEALLIEIRRMLIGRLKSLRRQSTKAKAVPTAPNS